MTTANSGMRAAIILMLASLAGCASQPPSIAHTHIGHAMTGWADTPGQEGLFVTAENAALDARQAADRAVTRDGDLAGMKEDIARVIAATSPAVEAPEGDRAVVKYGVKNALSAAEHHISFAAASKDSSENVRRSAGDFVAHVQVVLDRCDLVSALGNEILDSSTPEEADLLAGELRNLVHANVSGEETNGDGIAGSVPHEYGMKQLREELQAMIDREDPPYRTVDRWYLFNLIRLPSGEWIFRHFNIGGGSGGGSPY